MEVKIELIKKVFRPLENKSNEQLFYAQSKNSKNKNSNERQNILKIIPSPSIHVDEF